MKKIHFVSLIVLIIFLLGFLSLSLFTVSEGYQAIVMRLGTIKTRHGDEGLPKVYEPGLHFKMPFIDTVRVFDVRFLTLDNAHLTIVTAMKKDVSVDYYAKWSIENLALFYQRTSGDIARGEKLLQQRLNNGIRSEFGKRTIQEVVSEERDDIMITLLNYANRDAKDLGIAVNDVRIKRIDLPDEVVEQVFERMRAERLRIVQDHLASGKAQAEMIRADADKEAILTRAKAKRKSEFLRAHGDQIASKTYADAYSKNPDFYAFYRSLLAYQNTFNDKKDILVLKPDSEFFQYFNGSKNTEK
jgi:modulator of FtsH protease HflC